MKFGDLKGKTVPLSEAHEAAVLKDRRLWVDGQAVGLWYQDYMLDYVHDNGDRLCVVEDDTETTIRVRLAEEKQVRTCPLCGKEYAEEPALSRQDGKIQICPDCGMAEALGAYEDAQKDGEILDAMRKLGHKGTVKIRKLDADRSEVFLNGERFGIWDFIKHTFVD